MTTYVHAGSVILFLKEGRINQFVDRPALEKLGFVYDASVERLYAPKGWTLESTGKDSGVIRQSDVVRGGWGYQSPVAHECLQLLRRYVPDYVRPHYFDGYIWYKSRVKDALTGEVISPVFTCAASQVRVPGDDREHQKADNDAYAWLMEHFPSAHDPTAYWDE